MAEFGMCRNRWNWNLMETGCRMEAQTELTQLPVRASLMYTCNVLITVLTDEPVDLIVGSFFRRHDSASEFITVFSTSESLDHPRLRVSMHGVCRNRPLHSSPPPRGVQRLSQQTSCASLVSPGRQSAFRRRVQVSNPQVPGPKIERACVDQKHSDHSKRWGCRPRSLTMRSACLTRVALARAAADVSVVIASSSRFLHSAVCSCPDIDCPAR